MKTTYEVETSNQQKIDRKECVVCDWKYRYVLKKTLNLEV